MVGHAGWDNLLTSLDNFLGEGRPGLGVGQALLAQVLECLAAELARVSDLLHGALGACGDYRRVDSVVTVVLAVFLAVVAGVEVPDPAQVTRGAAGDRRNVPFAAVFREQETVLEVVLDGNRHIAVVVEIAGDEFSLSLRS